MTVDNVNNNQKQMGINMAQQQNKMPQRVGGPGQMSKEQMLEMGKAHM